MIRWFRPERKAVLRSPFNFYENFFTFDDPSSPCVCFSACSGCTHRWHAASNSNACHFENESGAKPSPSKRKKNTKKKKINKKYQKRKFDARTTPDTCRLFKTSQKMVRRVPTPVRPQRSRKLRLTKTPARRLDAAARYHEVLSLATLHNFSSLEVTRFDFFLPLWNLLIIILVSSSISTHREILVEKRVQKFDFEASKRGKENLLCAIVRSIILKIWFVKKSYLKVFFGSSRGSYSVACRLAACLLFLYFFFLPFGDCLFSFFFFAFFSSFKYLQFLNAWFNRLWLSRKFWFFFSLNMTLNWSVMRRNCYIYSFEMKFVVTNDYLNVV